MKYLSWVFLTFNLKFFSFPQLKLSFKVTESYIIYLKLQEIHLKILTWSKPCIIETIVPYTQFTERLPICNQLRIWKMRSIYQLCQNRSCFLETMFGKLLVLLLIFREIYRGPNNYLRRSLLWSDALFCSETKRLGWQDMGTICFVTNLRVKNS